VICVLPAEENRKQIPFLTAFKTLRKATIGFVNFSFSSHGPTSFSLEDSHEI
jgi:hypothetical protein